MITKENYERYVAALATSSTDGLTDGDINDAKHIIKFGYELWMEAHSRLIERDARRRECSRFQADGGTCENCEAYGGLYGWCFRTSAEALAGITEWDIEDEEDDQ